jgi:DNA-binding NarL/FixJ family response regulator
MELNLVSGLGQAGTQPPHLTPRENDVLRCLAVGMLDKEISDKLGISFWTVRKNVRSIFLKLHAGNRTEAAREWLG